MNIEGEIVFSVRDTKKEIKSIDEKMILKPTELIDIGELITRRIKSSTNSWIYKVRFDGYYDFIEKIIEFSETLFTRKDEIEELKNNYEVVDINLYIRSEEGQMGYEIPYKALERISELKIDLSFHILSFGMVSE